MFLTIGTKVNYVDEGGMVYEGKVTVIHGYRTINLEYTENGVVKTANSVVYATSTDAPGRYWLAYEYPLWYQWTAPSPALMDGKHQVATMQSAADGTMACIVRDADGEYQVYRNGEWGKAFVIAPELLEDAAVQAVIAWLRDGKGQPV